MVYSGDSNWSKAVFPLTFLVYLSLLEKIVKFHLTTVRSIFCTVTLICYCSLSYLIHIHFFVHLNLNHKILLLCFLTQHLIWREAQPHYQMMVGNSHLQSKYFKELTLQNKINYPSVNRKFQFPKIRWCSLSKSNKLKNTFSYFIKKILEEASKSYLFFQSSSKIIALNLSTRLCFVQSSKYVPKLTSRKPSHLFIHQPSSSGKHDQ